MAPKEEHEVGQDLGDLSKARVWWEVSGPCDSTSCVWHGVAFLASYFQNTRGGWWWQGTDKEEPSRGMERSNRQGRAVSVVFALKEYPWSSGPQMPHFQMLLLAVSQELIHTIKAEFRKLS